MNDKGVFYSDKDVNNQSNRANNMTNTLLIGIVVFIIGIVALTIGIVSENKAENYIETNAVITDIEVYYSGNNSYSYIVHINYMVDEKEFNTTLKYYDSSFYVGKEIVIKYNQDNPYEVTATGVGIKILNFGVGGMFMLIGIVLLVISINNAVKRSDKNNKDYALDVGKKKKDYWDDLK